MEVIHGYHNLQPAHHGCVLTIGNFDGLHRGHQAVIETLCGHGHKLDLPSMMMTFEPTAREFFQADAPPARLASLQEKIEDAGFYGLDRMLIVHFEQAFSTLSPEHFIRDLLVARLGVQLVIVGENFHFGAGRGGDLKLLGALGNQLGFQAVPMPTVLVDNGRVSSTRVRTALAQGDVRTGQRLLGRVYRMRGRVIPGQRLGRTLDMPTANLRITRKPALRFGVYAVKVRLDDDSCWLGAASIGTRPTVGGHGCLLEVYLLNFDGELYGRQLDVYFHAFLRPEECFADVQVLRERMHADVADVRTFFASADVGD